MVADSRDLPGCVSEGISEWADFASWVTWIHLAHCLAWTVWRKRRCSRDYVARTHVQIRPGTLPPHRQLLSPRTRWQSRCAPRPSVWHGCGRFSRIGETAKGQEARCSHTGYYTLARGALTGIEVHRGWPQRCRDCSYARGFRDQALSFHRSERKSRLPQSFTRRWQHSVDNPGGSC